VEIVGNRRFVEIQGAATYELPPLLIRSTPRVRRLDRVMDMAGALIEGEDLIPHFVADHPVPECEFERRRMELAINLVDQYLDFIHHWQWGDSVLEWIRQCEITFEARLDLRSILRPDVWPHAGRSSFVTLLEDKHVPTSGVVLDRAVGLRLTFRQPPPISCFSDQFLLYLNSKMASAAFHTWEHMSPDPLSALPPERFQVQVVEM